MNKKDMHTLDPITCKCVPNCRRCKLIKMRSLPMPTETYTLALTSDEASHLANLLDVTFAKADPTTEDEWATLESVKTISAKVRKFWE